MAWKYDRYYREWYWEKNRKAKPKPKPKRKTYKSAYAARPAKSAKAYNVMSHARQLLKKGDYDALYKLANQYNHFSREYDQIYKMHLSAWSSHGH